MKRPSANKGGRSRRTQSAEKPEKAVVRIQTGVRMDKQIVLVLKALAASLNVSLGELLEGIALHAFEGRQAFTPETLAKVNALKHVYDLDLTAADSHHLVEAPEDSAQAREQRR